MHEELGSVDEDLIPTVSYRAVPPCALRYRREKEKGIEKKVRKPGGNFFIQSAAQNLVLTVRTYHYNRKNDHKG